MAEQELAKVCGDAGGSQHACIWSSVFSLQEGPRVSLLI